MGIEGACVVEVAQLVGVGDTYEGLVLHGQLPQMFPSLRLLRNASLVTRTCGLVFDGERQR